MPSNDRMEVLAAMAALKRKDPAAFKAALLELNIERWQDVSQNDYGKAIATCQAKLGDAAIDNNAEDAVAELSMRDKFDKTALAINAKSEPNAGINDDLAEVINGGATLAEGFSNAAKMLHARNANRAAASAAAK